ncbi:MAG: HAD hydrolase family protein, partial [Agathobacter rectalis]
MKLIALDLDGTLFNNKSQISRENIKAIKEATAAGINVVISTGRPFGGLPFEAIK